MTLQKIYSAEDLSQMVTPHQAVDMMSHIDHTHVRCGAYGDTFYVQHNSVEHRDGGIFPAGSDEVYSTANEAIYHKLATLINLVQSGADVRPLHNPASRVHWYAGDFCLGSLD